MASSGTISATVIKAPGKPIANTEVPGLRIAPNEGNNSGSNLNSVFVIPQGP